MSITLKITEKTPTFICKPSNNTSIYPQTSPLHCYIHKCMFDSITVCCVCNKCICRSHSTNIDKTDVIICELCKKNPHYNDILITVQQYYAKPSYYKIYYNKIIYLIKCKWINSKKINPCLYP